MTVLHPPTTLAKAAHLRYLAPADSTSALQHP